MVSAYQDSMTNLLDKSFPLKLMTISDRYQPWFNEDLRLLRRQKQREYTKNGKSEKYLKLVDSFKEKASSAIEKYKEKLTLQVLEGERGSIYPALKRLGMRPGDDPHETFTLPDYVDANLSPEESVKLVAQHFSSEEVICRNPSGK